MTTRERLKFGKRDDKGEKFGKRDDEAGREVRYT